MADELRVAARALYEALSHGGRILITSEPFPDGDAFGAEIALAEIAEHAFRSAGRTGTVTVWNDDGCPPDYAFLEGAGRIAIPNPSPSEPFEPFDLAIVVDGGVERCGGTAKWIEGAKRSAIVDHHRFGSRASYDLRLFNADAASTTELLWTFYEDPQLGIPLSTCAAEALYLGLIYDTGSFQYPATSPRTHTMAARLIETGFDFAQVHERVLLMRSFDEMLETSRLLASTRRAANGQITFVHTTPEALLHSGGSYARIIQPIIFVDDAAVGLVFHEFEPERFRISLRARGKVDVGKAARELEPGGGGHARAAGCQLDGPADEVIRKVIDFFTAKLPSHPA